MPLPTTTSGAREALGAAYRAPSAKGSGAMTASQAKQIKGLNRAAGFNQPSNFRPVARALTPSPRPLANTPTGQAAIKGAANALNKVRGSAPVAGALRAATPAAKAAGRFAGSAAGGGVLAGALSLAGGLADPNTSVGAAATGATGAGIGAFAGASLGALGGPVGATIGGIVGGSIGDWAGKRLGQALFPQKDGPGDDYTGMVPQGFSGGQTDGRSYFVQANIKTYDDEGELRTDSNYSGSLVGPVTTGQVSLSGVGNDESDFLFVGAWTEGDPPRVENGSVTGQRVGVLSPAEGISRGSASITNLIPSGAAPDTGGDPPPKPTPIPGATPISSPKPVGSPAPDFPVLALPAIGLAAAGMAGAAAGGGPALAPASIPALAPLFGPGPTNAPRGAGNPKATPGASTKPRSAPGGRGAGGSGGSTRTKPKPKCPCNKGLLGNIGSLLQGNVGQGAQLGLLAKIDATTTGTAITTAANAGRLGAIAAKLQTMQAFAEKAWRNTHADKLINLLTLTTVIHNGAMISRDIGETLGYVVSNGLAVVGVKDEEGNALDINGLVGSSVSNFIKSVVGEDVYNDTRTAWQKANRVLQAGSNIIWTIRNINDATQDVLEWTAENTGKIGNALIKYGVVGDRAYPFMSERVKAQDFYRRKFSRVFDGLESAENTASSLAVVTSNVREIQEEVNELGEARTRFTDAVSDFGPEDIPGLPPENQLSSSSPENQPIATAEAAAEAASQSPDVAIATDANRGDPPDDATP